MDFYIGDIQQINDNVKEDEVGKPIMIPVEIEDDVIIKHLGGLEEADMLEFLEKMRTPTFETAINTAIRMWDVWMEELRVRSLTKYMIDNSADHDVIRQKIEEAGGEFLHFWEPGNYIVAGFSDEEKGAAFQKSWNKPGKTLEEILAEEKARRGE